MIDKNALLKEYEIDFGRCKIVKIEMVKSQLNVLFYNFERFKKLFGKTWIIKGLIYIREREEKLNSEINEWLVNQGKRYIYELEDDLVNIINERVKITKWDIFEMLFEAEKFNGFGYRSPEVNIKSPYLWSGTNLYERGKFSVDGKFDKKIIDKQSGIAAGLKLIKGYGLI